jgi:ATP-dependent DNA helicase RecQ
MKYEKTTNNYIGFQKHLENQNQLKKEQLQAVIHYIMKIYLQKQVNFELFWRKTTDVAVSVPFFISLRKIRKKMLLHFKTKIVTYYN